MATVAATVEWTAEIDRYVLWAEPPAARVAPEPVAGGEALLLLELDDQGRETGRIAGLALPLLEFERWQELPELELWWQLPGQEPLPLRELLRREQRRLRAQAGAAL